MARTEYQRIYSKWGNIKQRCYNPNNSNYPWYGGVGVTMCDEWLTFKAFHEWYVDNYYEVDGENMCVDKDILDKQSKVYSPETCIIVPERINNMFVSRKNNRGNLPVGVQQKGERYQVKVRNISNGNKNEYHGTYATPERAFEVYARCKEVIIQGVAEDYKDKIPTKLYRALMEYKIGD